jgi:hypothetical protein
MHVEQRVESGVTVIFFCIQGTAATGGLLTQQFQSDDRNCNDFTAEGRKTHI